MNDETEIRLECIRLASELDKLTEFGIASLSVDDTLAAAIKFFEWVNISQAKATVTTLNFHERN